MAASWLFLSGLLGVASASPYPRSNSGSSSFNYFKALNVTGASNNVLQDGGVVKLTSQGQIVTFDYGATVSGFPVFGVKAASGSYVEVEFKYSEQEGGLALPYADGPYGFVSMLANNFRTETVNVTDVVVNQKSAFQSYFIQGSQRWQSVRLTQGDSVEFSYVGFIPTSATTALQDQKGNATFADNKNSFSSSNDMYNRIWQLGPHSNQHACFKAETQPTTWDLAKDGTSGMFIRGQRQARASTLAGNLPAAYNLTFEAKIKRGGFGWTMDAGIQGWGPSFFVTSNLPSATTFSTWNSTLLPKNTLTLGDGVSIVNQTTLPSYILDRIQLEEVEQEKWIKVQASSVDAQVYTVSLNGKQVVSYNISDYVNAGPSPFYLGPTSVGFGGFQDQDAYYRNVVVSSSNGTRIYNSTLNSEDIKGDFGVLSNSAPVCVDGGKRDRLVWTGDFYIGSTTNVASNQDYEVLKGTIGYVFDYQTAPGALGQSLEMGLNQQYGQGYALPNALITLNDYQLDFLNAYHLYWVSTGDLGFIKQYWANAKKQMAFSLGFVAADTQLWGPPSSFKGVTNGTTPSSMLVWTLGNMAELADQLGESSLASSYRQQAAKTKSAINNLLWDEQAGHFQTVQGNGNFSYIDLATSVLGNVTSSSRVASQVSHLQDLAYGIGYVDSSSIVKNAEVNFSPYLSGYLLEALGQVNVTGPAKFLLDGIWTAMAKPGPMYSGGGWEYVYPDGTPALGLYTSLGHPWATGATAYLTRYGLGVRPTSAGYSTYTVAPLDLGLEYANGCVNTPKGSIKVDWKLENGSLKLDVYGPSGTTGTVVPPIGSSFTVNGKKGQKRPITVYGGKKYSICSE